MDNTRPNDEMYIQWDDQEMVTLEIDGDSLDAVEIYDHFSPAIAALQPIAVTGEVASVYISEIPSVNFGTPCNSIFMCVIGDDYILEKLFSVYKAIDGVRCRYSDMLNPAEMDCQIHVVDGYVWQPYEPGTWKVASSTYEPIVPKSNLKLKNTNLQTHIHQVAESGDDLIEFGEFEDDEAFDLADIDFEDPISRLLKLRTYQPESLSLDPDLGIDSHTAAQRYEKEYGDAAWAMLLLDELQDFANHMSPVIGEHFVDTSDGFDELSWMVDEIKGDFLPLSQIEGKDNNRKRKQKDFFARNAAANIKLQIKLLHVSRLFEYEISSSETEYSYEVLAVIRLCFARLSELLQKMQDF